MPPFHIITCPEWDAEQPKAPAVIVPKAVRVIMHHTAGHVAQLGNPSITTQWEAEGYARAIQYDHMHVKDWNDSGHNFLVCRAGYVLQGRWHTVSAIEAGHMVESAHCPGQNGEIGIEFEHDSKEEMTRPQRDSAVNLLHWISLQYNRHSCLPIDPHHDFYATACPANLESEIPILTKLVNESLKHPV